jgi:hypothetical protein
MRPAAKCSLVNDGGGKQNATSPAHPISDAALESDIAILGKKGRGKSYTARGIVERLLDKGRRVIVLDPLSTWWGLKAGPNAYPIPVIGGPEADLPLDDRAGEALGRYLATADQSVVLDLGAMRKAELVRFATPFLEELYTHNRDPLWLVLEEADVFAPQQPMPDTARMLGEIDRIARRGRQFGFRLISLTQRPARLNKDVLTQLSTLVALGITSPQDRDAIKAWVEGAGDRDKAKLVLESLASLKVGEGWVWSPDQGQLNRVTFPPIRTLDTSATPKAGEKRAPPSVRKDVDVDALRAALVVAVPADSESKPFARPRASEAEIAAAEQRGEARGRAAGYADGRKHGFAEAVHEARRVLESLVVGAATEKPARPNVKAATAHDIPSRRAAETPEQRASALSPTARKILDVIQAVHPVSLTFKAAALRAGASPRSSQFRQYEREIVASGEVEMMDGGRMRARAAGNPALAGCDHVETYAAKLPPSFAAMLRAVAAAPKPLTREAIAEAAGVSLTSSGLPAGLKELRAMELIVQNAATGAYQLADGMR